MISRLPLTLLFAVLLYVLPLVGHAVERHALVIGNSEYAPFSLEAPTNDAKDMAVQLQSMGYKLFANGPLIDLDRLSIERAIDEFAQSLPLGANAVFYFAGHGMANDRDSYLLPINSGLEFQSELRVRTIGLRSIVDTLKTYNPEGTNVLLLDANRNNPLSKNFLGIKNGLQPLKDVPEGVFVGYSSINDQQKTGDVTLQHNAYTRQLLDIMATQPGLSIKTMHALVAENVSLETNGAQIPVSEDRIYGSLCFDTCASLSNPAIQSTPLLKNPLANIEVKPTRNYWKIAGGVILGMVVFAVASDNDDTGNAPIAVSLTAPEQ